MTDEEFRGAEARFEADSKSTAPASKGMVLREIRAAIAGVVEAAARKFRAIERRQASTDALIADLDARLQALEDEHAERER